MVETCVIRLVVEKKDDGDHEEVSGDEETERRFEIAGELDTCVREQWSDKKIDCQLRTGNGSFLSLFCD